ncbi:MAG: nucleotidyl transferase AbiEii/AbiGii toxin family protein [Ginsengibacter sp.]
MIKEGYKNQVKLLLSIIPEIAKEKSFALHGGTAINLFIRNMPRLSVDIDLTYLPLENFEISRSNINAALKRIMTSIIKILPEVKINYEERNSKLYVSIKGVLVKVEVNLTGRGALHTPVMMDLCEKAQEEFDAFVSMNVLPRGQIFGSKICAALDRQHPRDLFDLSYLLNNEGITTEVKEGFLLYLLGHGRPINEVLSPNWKDQQQAIETQFAGMSVDNFSYEDYRQTREAILNAIHKSLTTADKKFLLGFKNLEPDWTIYDFELFPSIKWKLENLKKLKANNPEKHAKLFEALKQTLGNFKAE